MNTGPTTSADIALDQLLEVAKRRKLVALVGLAIGLAVGIAWYVLAPRTYAATSRVTITPITSNPFAAVPVNQLVNIATETAVMTSTEVAGRAAAQMESSEDPRDLLDRLTVSAPLSSLVMDITFEASTPEEAASGANAFARSYLDFRGEKAEERRAGLVQRLREELTAIPEVSEAESAGRSPDALAEERAGVTAQLTEAVSMNIIAGHLVSEALPPRVPRSPRKAVAGAGGLLLGAFLGAGVAWSRERRDDRLLSERDVRAETDLPILGRFPSFDSDPAVESAELDEVALVALQLHGGAGRYPSSCLALRADPRGRTGIELLAWWLRGSAEVVLLDAHEARDVDGDGATGQASAPRSGTGGTAVFEIIDGGEVERLSDALVHASSVDLVLVVVELGVTRRADLLRTLSRLAVVADVQVALIVIERSSRLASLGAVGSRARGPGGPRRWRSRSVLVDVKSGRRGSSASSVEPEVGATRGDGRT